MKTTSREPLEPPDTHHFSAALGWLELGNWQESEAELGRVSRERQGHPAVEGLRCEIFSKAGNWMAMAGLAEELAAREPMKGGHWIQWAYATRRKEGGGIAPAKVILTKAREQFPKEPLICYNLACYECQLGDLAKAEEWLKKAFELGDRSQLHFMAMQDLDLEPLWARLRRQ